LHDKNFFWSRFKIKYKPLPWETIFSSTFHTQSISCTNISLGTPKLWPLLAGGRCSEVPLYRLQIWKLGPQNSGQWRQVNFSSGLILCLNNFSVTVNWKKNFFRGNQSSNDLQIIFFATYDVCLQKVVSVLFLAFIIFDFVTIIEKVISISFRSTSSFKNFGKKWTLRVQGKYDYDYGCIRNTTKPTLPSQLSIPFLSGSVSLILALSGVILL
jgi:hypothetical protein